MQASQIYIPADVPRKYHEQYARNFNTITRSTGRLFLFAADHKLEHMNDDFVGNELDETVNDPEHLFEVASGGYIGAMATQLGLIAQYGQEYREIPYIVKLTGKTNLIAGEQMEPLSSELTKVKEVLEVKEESGLAICGVGLTVYLGSEYEGEMLKVAAKEIHAAHRHGLAAILWVYPRGKAVTNEADSHLLAGGAGVAATLGADFVKIHAPEDSATETRAELLKEAVGAAGKTGVICAGGRFADERELLEMIYQDIAVGGARGCAVGRNLFQRSVPEAHELSRAIAAIVYEGKTASQAFTQS